MASPPPLRAAEVGVRIHPRGTFYTMPMVGSYVGGDITAGILASGMHKSEELALLLDIGTNGEVVVGNKDFMVACSASAGPAFEGGSVTCGMRATRGAIDSVRILPDGPVVSTTTIDDGPPLGLCGTGLIDALAEMFLVGLLDRSGRFQVDRAPDRFRTSAEDGRPEFVLVPAWESGGGRDVVIRQTDVENLIRTKGAIYAAADCLVRSVGLSFADVQKVYIAGAFGNQLDIASCITIGLLPDVPDGSHSFHRQQLRGGGQAGHAQPPPVRRGAAHPRSHHLPGTHGGPGLHGQLPVGLLPAPYRSFAISLGGQERRNGRRQARRRKSEPSRST